MQLLPRATLLAVALAAVLISWATGLRAQLPQQSEPSAPRVVNLFHSDAIGNPLPPGAVAAIAVAGGAEDAKAAASRVAHGAIPALIEGASASAMEWSPVGVSVDRDGLTHTRLQQRVNGLRVFGAEVMVHLDGNNIPVGLNGEILADADPSALKATLDFDAAAKAARLHLAEGSGVTPDRIDRLTVESGELLIYNPAIVDAGASANYIAYHVVLSSADGDESHSVLVEARTGKLLNSFNNIESARNRDIRDLANATTVPGPQCHTETEAVGSPSPDCIATHRFTGETYDYFNRVFGRDSYDGAGATMLASVRYGTLGNAFWNGRQVAFGPGFATKDVVAHEWTHGLVASTARLVYLNQSGALNESAADVIASMIDIDSDWLIGEDLARGAIRSLADPTLFGHPGKVSDTQYFCGPGDNGGVHVNSGVPNHAAFLMAQGGTYNGRTITGIGRDDTARVFYRALTTYMTAGSGFGDAYTALQSSCADQFGGAGSFTCQQVTAALDAVEMNQPACGSGGAATPDTYDQPAGSVGDDRYDTGSVLGASPQSHTFHDAGDADWVKFTVTAGATVRLETSNLGSQGDTVLRLYQYDAASSRLGILAEDDDGGGGLASKLDYTFPTAGDYYARVVHYNPAVFGANTGYTLSMSAITTSGDPFEPDNSSTQASVITPNGPAQVGHTFGTASDEDWVRFTAAAGTFYVVQTENLLPQSDTYLFLYSATNFVTPLASDDDGGGRLASRIVWTAPAAGTYFIRVRAYNQSSSGPAGPNTAYDLRVATTTTTPDTFEPDNTLAQAKSIALNEPQSHDFHAPSDHDWVTFAATSGSLYALATFDLEGRSDTVLELFDGSGNLLAANDDSGGGLSSVIVHVASASGPLFARVRQYDARIFGNSTGYKVILGSPACATAGLLEPNNTQADATPYPVTNGSPQSHDHLCPGDIDYIRFTAERNKDYDIRTSALGSSADTVIELLDSSGSRLAFDDDGGGGLASRIVWRATADGTFFVRTRHYNSQAFGPNTNYQLSILGTGTSGTQDSHEDDDTQSTARTLAIGTPHSGATAHNFHDAGDADWVVVNGLTSGGSYAIETFNLGNYADTVLEVYNGTTLLGFDDDGGGGLASRLLFTAPGSGTVHAKVIHYSSSQFGANTNYDIRVGGAPSSSTGDSYEPDDSIGDPTAMAVDSTQLHNFHVAGDQDWVSFPTTDGSTYLLSTANLCPGSDTVLSLYRADGTFITANDDGGGGLASRIVHTATGISTLMAQVRHFSSAAAGVNTCYELRLTRVNDTGGDSFENDNTPLRASPVPINGILQTRTFHVPGDVDWISFPATLSESYVLATSNLGPQSDTVLDLFAPNGATLLRSNDDDGSSLASRIEWTAPSTGTYFVRISHFSPTVSGPDTNYQFRITSVAGCATGTFEPDNTPAQAATQTLTPGNTRTGHDFGCAGDVDWVRLTGLTAGSRYAVETTNLGTTSDTVMTLYNETATTPIFENDDSGGTLASRIEFLSGGGGWTSHAPMPTPRWETGSGVINGVIYVGGGYSSSTSYTNVLEAYDTRTNTWTTLTPTGPPPPGHASATGTYNGRIYLAGGNNNIGTSNGLYIYDPLTNTVTSGPTMLFPRTYVEGAFINDVFYVPGGYFGGPFNHLQAYNATSNTWITRASMPTARSGHGTAVIGGMLYVVGGNTTSDVSPTFVGTLERYDPANNSWATLAPMPTPRAYAATAAINGKLYVFGGRSVSGWATQTVESYDPVTNTWSSEPSLTNGRSGASVQVIGGRAYVIGGYGTNYTNYVDSFVPVGSPGSDQWVRVRHYDPTASGATTAYSLRLTQIGGAGPDTHEPDNTHTGAISAGKSLTTAAAHVGATAHNFHVAGDEDWMYFDGTGGNTCFFFTFGLGQRSDTVLHLYTLSLDELVMDDDGGGGLGSLVYHTFTGNQRVLLKVRHANASTAGADTNYNIAALCYSDPHESNDLFNNAAALTVNGASQSHIIGKPGDYDWASFSATAGTSYVIETHNLESIADTVITLFGGINAANQIAEDDESGDEPGASKIVFVPQTTGTYWVRVRDYDHPYFFGPGTGYQLRVRTGTSDERTSIADVSVVAGDGTGRVQLRVRPLESADAMKVQVFTKGEQLAFVGAESLIPGKNGESRSNVRLLNSTPEDPVVGAYLEGKQLAQTMAGTEALAMNFRLTGEPGVRNSRIRATVRVTLISESGEVRVEDIPTVVSAADAQPRINALNPQAIPTETGGTFTVYGSNFVITPKVFLVNNGSPLELRDVRIGLDGSWLEATVPAGTKIGAFKVRVQNPNGSFSDSGDDLYVTRGGGQCDFGLSADRVVVSGAGGQVLVNVTTGQACVWVPQPGVNWIGVNSPNEASGSGQASFNVNSSTDGSARSGVVTIGSRTLTIEQPANSNPVLSSIPSQTIDQDTSTGPLPFTVTDDDNDAVTVTASSSNPTLVPPGNIVISPVTALTRTIDGLFATTNRTVTVTPAAGQFGQTTITLTGTDGRGGTGPTSFTVIVRQAGGVGIPRDVRADASGTIVDVQWAPPSSGEMPSSYRVEAGRAPGANEISGTTTQTRLTLNLAGRPRGRWFVRVIGIAGSRESQPSAEVFVDIGAPGPPRNLRTSVAGDVVTLTWDAPESADADSYILQANVAPACSGLVAVPVNGTSFVASSVPQGAYCAQVIAVNAFGQSSPSSPATIVVGATIERPGPPTNLTHTVTGSTIALSWVAPTGGGTPSGYVLRAGSASGLSNIAVAPIGNVLTFTATNVPDGTYFVRVSSINAAGESLTPSNEVQIVVGTPVVAPGAPSGLNITVSGNQVTATWAAPTTGGPVENYVIDAGSATGLSNIAQVAVGNTTSFTAGGIPPGVYFVRVRAVNRGGTSGPSNEVRVTVP